MKCSRCWAEKAYVHPFGGWRDILLNCFLVRRMKCRHCYHKFFVPWLLTIGKQVRPPAPSTRRWADDDPQVIRFDRPRRREGQEGGASRRRRKAA